MKLISHFITYYNNLKNNGNYKKIPLKHLCISLLAALGIWFIGPHVAIANKILLASTSSRLLCLLLIAIGWGIYNIYNNHRAETQEPVTYTQESVWHAEQTQNALKSFHRKLRQAIDFLNTNKITHLFIRKTLPCYLLLGPTQSGKTSLLLHSGLDLYDVRRSKLITPTPTQQFDWWFGTHAIYLDPAGNLSEAVWRGMLSALIGQRRYHPIKGVLITLSLPSLHSPYQQQLQLENLKKQLAILSQYGSKLPVYFMFTQCDLIAGFSEFFDDLGKEEREQCWGMSFLTADKIENLSEDYEQAFVTFLKRLNERLLWRLHQERNVDKCISIKNFPLQMENLKAGIFETIHLLSSTTSWQLHGIYFTSSLQKGVPTDYVNSSNTSTAITQADNNTPHYKQRHKPYFSKQLFESLLLAQTIRTKATVEATLKTFVFLGLGLGITVLASITWLHHDSGTQTIPLASSIQNQPLQQSMTNTLSEQENKAMKESPQLGLLFELNQLEHLENSKTHKNSWLQHLSFGSNKKEKQLTHDAYYQTLVNIFLPHFKKTIEAQISSHLSDHSPALYNSLKSYLMLSNAKLLDKNYLENWYADLLPPDQHELSRHLDHLLSEKLPALNLDYPLMSAARDALNHLSLPDLLLLVLNDALQRAPSLALHLPSELFVETNLVIPAIYQKKYFHHIYFELIPNLSKNVLSHNWVLGEKNQLTSIAPTELTAAARILYLKYYASFWNEALGKMHFIPFNTVQQATQALALLSKPTPALQQLFSTIRTNTAIDSEAPEFNRTVANSFETVNTLLEQMEQSHKNNAINTAINNLAVHLNKIVSSNDTAKMAFVIASGRMELRAPQDPFTQLLTLSSSLPPPLHTWFNKLATNSWKVILQETQQYINSVWQTTVLSTYDTTLDQHYPLFKEAESDITLNDFAKFFAPNGIMDQFFQTYLQPFIDTKKTYWEWKKVDDESLVMAQSTLEMLMRASLIRKMYFSEDKPLPSVGFTLVPIALSPTATAFALEIMGQTVQLAAGSENPEKTHFTWPSLEGENATLKFTNLQGESSTLTEAGPWALFRLLDKAHLTTTTNPKRFKLTFDLNGSAAKYELIADKSVNPFIEGILSSFRCPKGL